MDAKKRRTFLLISNTVVSVLAAAAIACCFILPLWKAEFSLSFTNGLADTLKNAGLTEEKSGAEIRFTSDGAAASSEIAELLPDVYSGSGKDVINSVIDALCEENFSISFSASFSSDDMLRAVYKQDPSVAEKMIDKAVDGFVRDVEKIITGLLQTAVRTAAKEAVRSAVNDMLQSQYENENYDKFMAELGPDKERIESLIDNVIDTIMKEDATVGSVTDTVLASVDEVQSILANIPEYSESAALFDDEDRENIRKSTEELLSRFADGNGKINFKDTLIQTMLDTVSQAIDDLQSDKNGASISGVSVAGGEEQSASKEQSAEKFRAKIKQFVFNVGNGAVIKLIVCCMAVTGALLMILLFMLFYPILRTLTNIGKGEPGFSMFLPIFGGLSSYFLLVISPSVFPAVIRLIGASGGILPIPARVLTVLNAFSLRFSSGTVIAFIFALALIVFSFFYEHHRRLLRKEISKAEKN